MLEAAKKFLGQSKQIRTEHKHHQGARTVTQGGKVEMETAYVVSFFFQEILKPRQRWTQDSWRSW
jgi:hypothetical protein